LCGTALYSRCCGETGCFAKIRFEKPFISISDAAVPVRAYYANHKNGMDEIVPESDDMKNYSGYAIYYQLYSNKPSYISKYSKGGIVEHLGLTNMKSG
jgi:hypothetical protein